MANFFGLWKTKGNFNHQKYIEKKHHKCVVYFQVWRFKKLWVFFVDIFLIAFFPYNIVARQQGRHSAVKLEVERQTARQQDSLDRVPGWKGCLAVWRSTSSFTALWRPCCLATILYGKKAIKKISTKKTVNKKHLKSP
jgi:hypothetical protein